VFKKYIGQESPGAQEAPEPARTESPAPAAAPSYSAPAPAAMTQHRTPAAGTRNVLSSDVEIKGTVKFTNDLVVDGKIEGEIASDGNLTVGENARIKAEVKTGTVVIYGKVHGNITVIDRVELKASAEVVGDIKAKTLVIEAGAIFVGKSTVGTPAAGATAPAKAEAKADAAKQDSLAGINA
jgi:cytoskeletal protein CcmA (bactofilin family)